MGKQVAEKLAGACKIGLRFLHPRNSPRKVFPAALGVHFTQALDPNRSYITVILCIVYIVNPLKLTTSQSQLLSSTDDRHPNFDGRAALFHT